MLYLYAVGFEMEFPGLPISLGAQSITLALSGYVGVAAWNYARSNRRLLSHVISDEEADQLRISIYAEPLAATFTLPFAFVSPLAWNISWLSLLFFSWLLKRRSKKGKVQQFAEDVDR